MIDKLLEKEPKKHGGGLTELESGSGGVRRLDYSRGNFPVAEPEDEDSMSDIADIVKYVTNDEFFKEKE